MRLSAFPMCLKAVRIAYQDSPSQDSQVNPDATIPPNYKEDFGIAEDVLRKLNNKRLHQLPLSAKQLEEILKNKGEQNLDQASVFERIAVPMQNEDMVILFVCGCTQQEYRAVKRITDAYYEGDLRDILEIGK